MTQGLEKAETEPANEPVAKLPRSRLLGRMALQDLIRIGMFASLLVAVVALREPCAAGVAHFVGGFEAPPDAAPGPYQHYELMTAEEALKRWPDHPVTDAGVVGGDAGDAVGAGRSSTPPARPEGKPSDPAR